MAKTGRYVFRDGHMQKISDDVPKIASRIDGVYFRQPYIENFGGGSLKKGIEITSKSHKKAVMAEKGIAEFEESADDVKFEKAKKHFLMPEKAKQANTSV